MIKMMFSNNNVPDSLLDIDIETGIDVGIGIDDHYNSTA